MPTDSRRDWREPGEALRKFLYGAVDSDHLEHRVTMFASIAPQKSIITLIFGATMSYLILVVCGTMGSPFPVMINRVECGVHNSCTLLDGEKVTLNKRYYSEGR